MSERPAPTRRWFTTALRRALARPALTVDRCRPLGGQVYQLALAPGQPDAAVVKRMSLAAAHREQLLAGQWLPAVGLAGAGPPLLATIGEPTGAAAWGVYAWLAGGGLDTAGYPPAQVERLVDLVAALHIRCARHPQLAEVRQHGTALGYDGLAGRLDDAYLALGALDRHAGTRAAGPVVAALRESLGQARERAQGVGALLREVGGPDTVLHGDLWPCNVMIGPAGPRLIDWDRLGVGPACYDLSTLLLRLPAGLRRGVLDRYLGHLTGAGWTAPTLPEVIRLATAAEHARLATLVSWRVLDVLRSPGTAEWAIDQLQAIRTWWEQVDPRPQEVPG